MENILYFEPQSSPVNSYFVWFLPSGCLHRPGFCKVSWLHKAPQWIWDS